ncbi:MAG: putative holin-like toxin [Tumebacillaceae bacterium]
MSHEELQDLFGFGMFLIAFLTLILQLIKIMMDNGRKK